MNYTTENTLHEVKRNYPGSDNKPPVVVEVMSGGLAELCVIEPSYDIASDFSVFGDAAWCRMVAEMLNAAADDLEN